MTIPPSPPPPHGPPAFQPPAPLQQPSQAPLQQTTERLEVWRKFLGPNATLQQAEQCYRQMMNMVTQAVSRSFQKAHENAKKALRIAEGEE